MPRISKPTDNIKDRVSEDTPFCWSDFVTDIIKGKYVLLKCSFFKSNIWALSWGSFYWLIFPPVYGTYFSASLCCLYYVFVFESF